MKARRLLQGMISFAVAFQLFGHALLLDVPDHLQAGIVALPPPPPEASYAVTIRFEGGDVSGNVAKSLAVLWENKLLPVHEHPIEAGEVICTVYEFLPGGCRDATVELANKINGRRFQNVTLQRGEIVFYPYIKVQEYEFSTVFDERSKTQMLQLTDLTTNLRHLVKEKRSELGQITITLKAFEVYIPIESSDKATKAVGALRELDPTRVIPGIVSKDSEPPIYHINVPPRLFVDVCNDNQNLNDVGTQGELWHQASDSPSTPCPNENHRGNTEIILIDKKVVAHPDLDSAVLGMSNEQGGSLISGQKQQCKTRTDLTDKEHGTFMAGIIASQDNNFGLLGIHPDAIIKSIDWDFHSKQSDLASLANIVQAGKDSNRMQIYLFASQWEYTNEEIVAARKDHKDFRLTNLLAKRIKGVRPLWIAAAGNVKGNSDPEMGPKTPYGPMNLGDLPNVVIVAAYKKVDNEYHLLEQSNYADPKLETKFVHLAAPGQEILSTATATDYALGGGTSPAAAFVAGIASAMVCRHPTFYNKSAEAVKIRLMVSARPVFVGDEAGRVGSGILDPDMAMRDPTKTWIKGLAGGLKEIPFKSWKVANLEMDIKSKNLHESIPTEDVYRIVMVERKPPRQWIVYKRVSYDENGDFWYMVERIGPAVFQSEEFDLIQLTDNSTLKTSEVEDVIIQNPLGQ